MAINHPSARTENDTWDIVSSVGFTALAVAAARAVQSRRARPLAVDPFAEAFVQAAGETKLREWLDGLGDEADWDDGTTIRADFFGSRTKYFDEYFAAAPTPQVVILAAGLDARAHRLAWPEGTALYEVDQPKVLDFKARVLDSLGAKPQVDRHEVAVDLRDDWPTALREAGFDPTKPTAWLAEGLLIYLPGPAQDALFDKVHELSAPGSHIGAENGFRPGDVAQIAEAARRGVTLGSFDPQYDVTTLWYDDPRRDPERWLAERGWTVSPADRGELAVAQGRPFPEEHSALWSRSGYFTAVRD